MAVENQPHGALRFLPRIFPGVVGKNVKEAGHLASYAGIAPVTRRSGSSIRGESSSREGNTTLKRALFQSAFASINARPASLAYHDRTRAQGSRHNQAIIALARRRTNVLYAMLRDGAFFTEPTPPAAVLVAC